MFRTTERWIDEYKDQGALWFHNGSANQPHALLTSGKHSDGFFNSRLVTANDSLLRDAASDLIELFEEHGGDIPAVQCVVGPQTGATLMAEKIHERIEYLTQTWCYWASPEKGERDGVKSMDFSDGDLRLLRGKSVLLCEDVLTTGGSIDLTTDAVVAAGGKVLPFVLVLVNRSGLPEVNGKKIIALIDRPLSNWEADECPLCKVGSEAIRPKDEWNRLTASAT